MIKKLALEIIKRVLKFYYFHKYANIWKIKEQLQKHNPPNELLLQIYNDYFFKHGSRIEYDSKFKGIPILPHGPAGIFISGGARIGKNVVIFQQVTIGSNTLNDTRNNGSPTIGDNVYIGCGAKIIGKVHIGNNCRIGANAAVYTDLPPHSVAVQASTRIIQKNDLDNRHYSFCHGKWFYYVDGQMVEDKNKQFLTK